MTPRGKKSFSATDDGKGDRACNAGVQSKGWGIDEALTQRSQSMFHHILCIRRDPETRQLKHVGWITTPLYRCYIDERRVSAAMLKAGHAALEQKRQLWAKQQRDAEDKASKDKEERLKKTRTSMARGAEDV